jgi:hypothetical protein
MTNRVQKAAATVVAIGAMLMAPPAVSGADIPAATHTSGPHVRSNSVVILTLIQQATERSATFRGLIETIDASDAIVYVREGKCGHGIRACLQSVTTTAGHRMLWVRVDTSKDVDWNLTGSIGHELRHTIEVLNEPLVKNNADMFFLYQRIGYQGTGSSIETIAAVNAGNAVRAEVRELNRRTKAD